MFSIWGSGYLIEDESYKHVSMIEHSSPITVWFYPDKNMVFKSSSKNVRWILSMSITAWKMLTSFFSFFFDFWVWNWKFCIRISILKQLFAALFLYFNENCSLILPHSLKDIRRFRIVNILFISKRQIFISKIKVDLISAYWCTIVLPNLILCEI